MNAYLKHSRIAKVLVERQSNSMDFEASEAFLRATKVAVRLDASVCSTPAAQAATLTALTTSMKCFGSAVLVGEASTPLLKPMRCGATLGEAAAFFGATVSSVVPAETTHTILIGDHRSEQRGDFVRCWWDAWRTGVIPAWDDRALGASFNPLSGVAAGALAVREVFAARIGNLRAGKRPSIVSLWEPWLPYDKAAPGPALVTFAAKLWFVGLGHLGQGYLWSLAQLPAAGGWLVLQDDQNAGTENEATGLLTYAKDIGERKARVAASWFKGAWETSLIERRHHGDIRVTENDPTIVFAGLDNIPARLNVASAGFDYAIDAGVGHGPVDFESFQLRVLRKGVDLTKQWSKPEKAKDIEAMLETDSYRELVKKDRCGAFELAEGSVAVPFVGAFVGALGIAQGMRVASRHPTAEFLQAELGAPALATAGRMNERPSETMKLLEIRVGQVPEADAVRETSGQARG